MCTVLNIGLAESASAPRPCEFESADGPSTTHIQQGVFPGHDEGSSFAMVWHRDIQVGPEAHGVVAGFIPAIDVDTISQQVQMALRLYERASLVKSIRTHVDSGQGEGTNLGADGVLHKAYDGVDIRGRRYPDEVNGHGVWQRCERVSEVPNPPPPAAHVERASVAESRSCYGGGMVEEKPLEEAEG